jgi:peptide/nickel transport system permease protein
LTTTEQCVVVPEEIAPQEGFFKRIWGFIRQKPVGAVGAFFFFIMVLLAILAPFVSPYPPMEVDILARLQGPSFSHWLGTDDLGRDVLSRLLWGARITAVVSIASTVAGTTVGALIGIISGYVGGKTDMIIQRLMDIIMAFPALVLCLAIMAALGPSVVNVVVAISIPAIPRANRVSRSIAVSVKQFQFVEAVKAVGASPWRVILMHVLPNCLASYLIVATSMLGAAILTEASLSFLGFGIPPPEPSWGRALNEAQNYLYKDPWLAVWPGMAITLVVFGVNIFGDALRDVWDPRLKRL